MSSEECFGCLNICLSTYASYSRFFSMSCSTNMYIQCWHNGVFFVSFLCVDSWCCRWSTVNDKSLSKEEGCLGDVPEVKVTFHFQRQPRWWCDSFEWYLWEWCKGSCWQGCAPGSSLQERQGFCNKIFLFFSKHLDPSEN